MLKYVFMLCAMFMAAAMAGCGKGSSTYSPVYKVDTSAVKPSAASYPMGGAVQGTPVFGNLSTVTSFAGSGTAGTTQSSASGFANYSANSVRAMFNHPTAITTNGNVFYVADYNNNLIRTISTIDGTSKVGALSCTESGSAVSFNHPTDLAVKGDDSELYVVDSGNNRVLVLTLTARANNTPGCTVKAKIGSSSGLAGFADATSPGDARFYMPTGITTDGKYAYVADTGNQTIRMIDLATYAVYTLAGYPEVGSSNGSQSSARFNLPTRLTTTGRYLFVTDFGNRTIRWIDIKQGLVGTLAGIAGTPGLADTSLGVTATFFHPNGITTDGTAIYVSDYNDTERQDPQYQDLIRRIQVPDINNITGSTAATVTTIAGGISTTAPSLVNGNRRAARFSGPVGLTSDGTSLYVADSNNNIIRKISMP